MENNEEVVVAPQSNEGEQGGADDVVSIPKSEYEKLNQTLGSLKRELKDYKKSKDEPKETPKNQDRPDDKMVARLEKLALGQAGISHIDDIELARSTAKKWNMEIEEVLVDEDFKAKLERQQTNRSNIEATTNIRGGSNAPSKAKESPDYWIAKGVPPTPADISDRKVRAKIIRAMMDKAKTSGKTFYSD